MQTRVMEAYLTSCISPSQGILQGRIFGISNEAWELHVVVNEKSHFGEADLVNFILDAIPNGRSCRING